ncbi:MAG: putative peptidylprolyl cis-trans isomerase [Deltaproteobacteria bacterium]|nr:putative peptidylprolyl cis-trans isomerase [Deltaproteobacteria bacterium]
MKPMLKFMRKYARSYLIKVIFAVIIIVFVFYFGAGSLREKETKIAEVGSFDILYPEYYEAYNKELEMFRQLYRDKFDEKMAAELKDKVLQDMLNKYILLVEAKKLGISVSDQEFAELIGSIEAFRKDGKFDKDRYVAVLRQNKMDPEQFERGEKTMLLIRKVVSIVRDTGAPVTDADIWAGYVREKGKVDLFYSRFSPASFKDKVTVTEKELNDVYEKEKDRFRGEDTYRLKYIIVDGKSGLRDDQIYMDLLKAKDIDAYGRQRDLKVNDTGSMRQSELFKTYKNLKIETWVKDLRKGDVSLPVRDDGRSLIFQLVEREDGKPMEKSAALQSIKNSLATNKAKEKARLAAEDAVKNKSVDKKTHTGFISRTTTSIPKIGDIPRDNAGMLGLTKDTPVYDKSVDINGDYYVFGYAGEQEPDRQEWQKDKERFAQYYTARHKEQFLTSFLEESKQAMLKQGKIKILKNPKEI